SDIRESNIQWFQDEVRTEIEAILSARFDLKIKEIKADGKRNDLAARIQEAYADPNVDIVIGTGFEMCTMMAGLESYPIPTILSIVIDTDIQGIQQDPDGTCATPNLTFIQSPFDIENDLESLYEIKPYKKLTIVAAQAIGYSNFNFDAFIGSRLPADDIELSFAFTDATADEALANIPDDSEAVFLLPMVDRLSNEELFRLIEGINDRKLTSFSLLSTPMLEYGVYAAFDTDSNIERIPRRIALTTMKIAEGQAPEDLPVAMDAFTRDLIINMKTAREVEHYPNWDLMAESVLINVATPTDDARSLSFRTAIAEGLVNNLDIKIAEKETAISEKNISIARSNYLPQADASGSVTFLDDNTIQQSFGTRARWNVDANISASQLLVSEPALANIAIQKYLLESQQAVLRQNELDVVQTVANAYLDILQATALVDLRNQNVNVTRTNYNIAQNKEQVGYSGTNDVYRFESELALDNVDLNTAQATLASAKFNLNQVLNRPIKEDFELEDVSTADSALQLLDTRVFNFIDDPGQLDEYSDFIVEEAFRNLPELKQIEAAISAEQRNLQSQNRAFYLPTVALQGSYDVPIGRHGFPDNVTPFGRFNTYSVAGAVQIPIFQGNSRRLQQQQTKISIEQLNDQNQDLKNKLELQIRANLETAGASFSNLALSLIAEEASRKNFKIAQNSYQQGLLNVTSLIDAQNALLGAQINAINAEYTFIKDYLAVERAIGYYHFLSTEEEQLSFLQRFLQFVSDN
ncbi:MAG: TolC family protein, partial [Bacteroidota bacterium]